MKAARGTWADAGAACRTHGTFRPFLADVELGRKGISPLSIQKLCDARDVSADYPIRSKEIHRDFPQIVKLLSDLDAAYIPLVEDLLRTYVKSIHLKPSDPE